MTKLEMFFQGASKTAETPIVKSPNASGEGAEAEAGGAFDALLKNIAEKPQGAPLQNRIISRDGASAAAERDAAGDDALTFSGDKADGALPFRDAAPDLPIAAKLDQQLTLLIQAGLPLQGAGAPQAPSEVQSGRAPASQKSILDMIQLPTDENTDLNALQARASAQMKASVVHQETHFKPVPVGVMQDAAKPQGNAIQTAMPSMTLSPNAEPATSGRAFEQPKGMAIAFEAAAGAHKNAAEQTLQAGGSNGNGAGDAALPMAMLQRIASAVATESKQASAQEASQTTQSTNSPTHIVAKASEGVVRILNIQLHPAELGKVTVKMRLSGDTLEMELQASSEETADLLRKDSEKLTSLLRTSGYRPDSVVIVTASADTQAQDGATGQRQQAGTQSQAGGFQQGAAHSDGQQRRNSQESESGMQREQKSSLDEKTASNATSDLYL